MTVIAPSAGNSSVNPNLGDVFSSEESILRALAFVRHSAVKVETKNALRDQFLAYAGTYGETERLAVKNKIIALLRSEPALAPLVSDATSASATALNAPPSIGMTRPTPTFAPLSPEENAPAKPEAVVKTAPEPTPAPKEAPAPEVRKPEPVAEIPPAPTAPIATVPTGNAKARIDAIKRDINGKIGNPVNLIDTNEAVGKEYMAALLDAMKRAARGDSDLTRLEAAYNAALAVIQKGTSTDATVKTETPPAEKPLMPLDPSPVPPPPPVPPVIKSAPQPVAPAPSAAPSTIQRGLYHRPLDELDEESDTEASIPPRVEVAPGRPTQAAASERPVVPPVSPIKIKTIETKEPSSIKVDALPEIKMPDIKPEPKPAPAPIQKEEKLKPLNQIDTTLPEQISRLKAEATAREEAAKKPITDLKAPEVDQGLKQLLSEWSLFKGQGFFRKKPAGLDHPLYKQLAPLPMASVIAGRFEGVTPEIKHTLADYMTGWRYEQGIVHDMGETFEHYLRRVVKEILEKQRGAKEPAKK